MVNSKTGLPISPQNLKDRIDVFYNKFSIRKVRIHDLRHTYASLAIHGGATVRDVSSALGHTDTRITELIYIHSIQKNANIGASQGLSNLLNR
jgi:integrase